MLPQAKKRLYAAPIKSWQLVLWRPTTYVRAHNID
jgi:hypothetical protein